MYGTQWLPEAAVFVIALPTGFFTAFTSAHPAAFLIKQVLGPREEPSPSVRTKALL